MTRVSICVPTYNGERFVVTAIESILAQTFSDFELLVCDDCSTDGTLEAVLGFDDPRLRIVPGQRRLGLVGNWNRCVELASGDYTHVFHQDDVMLPRCVERLVDALDRGPQVGFAFTNIKTVDDGGRVIGGHWAHRLPDKDTVYSEGGLFRLLLAEGNLVPCQTVMVRTSCFRELGGFDSRLRYTPDLEMWLRLALHTDAAYIAEPLVLLRRHGGQESAHFLGEVQEVDEVMRAVQIVFAQQRSSITDPLGSYRLALGHLERWAYNMCRESLRRRRGRAAIALASRWLSYKHERSRALRLPVSTALRQPDL